MLSIWNTSHALLSRCALSLSALVFALLLLAPAAQAQTYTTNFPLTENPLSEGGRWINATPMQSKPGLAFGTQVGLHNVPPFDDSCAVLAGTWGPDQIAWGTVHTVNQQGGDIYEECQLVVRMNITPTTIEGHVMDIRAATSGTYIELGYWKGTPGNVVGIEGSLLASGAGPGLRDGDVLKLSAIGNVFTVYVNGAQILQGIDNNPNHLTTGNPGIASYLQGIGHPETPGLISDFGFTNFTATDDVSPVLTSIALAPANINVMPNATQQFTATALDQFGTPMPSQPAFTWSVSGGGTISSSGLFTAGGTLGGPFTLTVSGGGKTATTNVTVAPVGSGLTGQYWTNQLKTLNGTPTLTRTDPTVNFNWGNGSPDPAISADSFTARWTGQVQAQFSQTYTFSTTSDDGARLWVNNQLLVDRWVDQGPTEVSGTIALVAGQKYDIKMEYYENGGGASAQLMWSSPSTPKQVIPQSQLFQAAPASQPPTVATAALANPNPVVGNTSALSVLGADDGGEPALTYTWATTGTPPAAVAFSANGTNAAKSSIATFSKAGSYTLQATIRDAGGLTATSSVVVTVNQTLTAIVVAPASATVANGLTQSFTATASDQFAQALAIQPAFAWTVSGGGTIASSGLFTATTVGGPFTVTAASGAKSGTASVTVQSQPNQAPTVATAASANPNPVTGTTTALSVLGADDAGEPALTYTWATTGTPPAAVAFSANGTNAAKSSTATFSKAGSYTLQATIRDAGNLTASSNVVVTVNQALTAITVSPSSATVALGATQAFTATATDQFSTALAAQPAFTWTVAGGGTISSAGVFTAGATASGPFAVTATSGATSGTASVTVSAAPTFVYRINAGGTAVSPFVADQFVTGGGSYTSGTAVSTAGVANAAPAAVYQSERYGSSTYTLPGLTAGGAYTVRLHFAEIYWTSANVRLINVDINGTRVLAGLDIWTSAGGTNKALVRDFAATATAGGQIVIALSAAAGSPDQNPKISGIELLTTGPVNQAPTVATAASANPNPVTGTTTTLSVLGADDAGEAALTYSWATTGTPPAAVAFSANGTNAAKASTATFTKAGSYTLQATIRDAGSLTVTSNVVVTVNQTLTAIAVSPASATVGVGATQPFTSLASDQFGVALSVQPTITWTVSGGGTIASTGVFTAGAVAGGPFTVTAASGAKSGTASVTVSNATTAIASLNCGGGAVTPFTADQFASGGATWGSGTTVSTTGVANAAPMAVYQSERYGATFSYTVPGLSAGGSYGVRLHFAENNSYAVGTRVFGVAINGTAVLSNYDIVAAAGSLAKANVQSFTATANASGQLVIVFTGTSLGSDHNAKVCGIEVLMTTPSGGG